eukprot:CAMPEP_0168321218 /NCGR_PEP_ID=MMETSP0213-20121227/2138_1 /TAXON_ID=151035 /ORGANISM="Euplotes harpa, Strain FSP1.4" /LENGTH=92 /DNA_ID=CAMNT_0008322823 /DNA_START=44 /DNA_END=322 /DNA_ORIENTATION=-
MEKWPVTKPRRSWLLTAEEEYELAERSQGLVFKSGKELLQWLLTAVFARYEKARVESKKQVFRISCVKAANGREYEIEITGIAIFNHVNVSV